MEYGSIGERMTYGQIVAKRFKKKYFTKKNGWQTFETWTIQPEAIYLILTELKTKRAIEALVDKSWTKRLPRQKK